MKTSLHSFFAVVLIACGSDATTSSSNDNGTRSETSPASPGASARPGSCEAAGTKLCARACACPTDGKCRLGVALDGGAGTASINFDDEQGCLDLYVVLGCSGGGEPGFDYAKCESAVEESACVDSAGGQALLMPAECNVSRK